MNKPASFTMIDLFAGIGGFRLAAERHGGTCIGFSEIDQDAIAAYTKNYICGGEANLGDITKLGSLPQHDLLTGGVPCQSWSIAGRNLGFDDDRGQLWNDALFLLNKSKPKAFIFENVKGLSDPRNHGALDYIMRRVADAGYHAQYYVINAFDYGIPQSRVRIYIIGFLDNRFGKRFKLPARTGCDRKLGYYLDDYHADNEEATRQNADLDPLGFPIRSRQAKMSLSSNNNGYNDYFLFNDLRNGDTTIHSWDILGTTERQRMICLLLLRNRRKSTYGFLDGNPLSLRHFQELDPSITQRDLDELVEMGILKDEQYSFCVKHTADADVTEEERLLLAMQEDGTIIPDAFASSREWKVKKIRYAPLLESLTAKGVLKCVDVRYDFRNTKISTGLFGVNRIFLPSSSIFPTLVASDSNDYVTTEDIEATTAEEYRRKFVERVYKQGNYRRITKKEACRIQGFLEDFVLPEARSRWMKLIGNSVSVHVIELLIDAICKTGVFDADGKIGFPLDFMANNRAAAARTNALASELLAMHANK
jgi:DNA (cytosine-5)-methyltransferase 1